MDTILRKELTATPACRLGRRLGKLRPDIKKHLSTGMSEGSIGKEIDKLVKKWWDEEKFILIKREFK
jgi:hypothetical protein